MATADKLVEAIAAMVQGGKTPADAARLLALITPEADVQEARVEYEKRARLIRTLREPPGLEDPGLQLWYVGPSDEDRFWPPLRELLFAKGWPKSSVDSVDSASTRVLSLLKPPGLEKFSCRGLVLGYVQSGKTANYTAVIAKAADVGYKFFIVLSGVHNVLRAQTQSRLEKELVDLNSEDWVKLTETDRDFSQRAGGNADAFLTAHSGQRVLCVVKKNATVLRRLLRWLRSARVEVRSSCPVLVIDDEADQASVNASGSSDDRTRVNQLLLDTLSELPRAAYVGYTATPFANIFIEPSVPIDLYPRDFILDLPRPSEYFGAERIFGRERLTADEPDEDLGGLDIVRLVPDDEATLVKPRGQSDYQSFQPQLTPSLRTALLYFWLATAARHARGQSDQHSTMLVHTTLYAIVQDRFRPLIESLRNRVRELLLADDREMRDELRELWESENGQVPPGVGGEAETDFDAVKQALVAALDRCEVVVENSRAAIRLDYGEPGRVVIVVGGNTLSRGLTLEGLVVSYFVRAATAYDTLLQMGRWFGYRSGYADLPRVWLTRELQSDFFELATVEQEMREDIQRYEIEQLTPLDFGPRIRTHPKLSITSQLKMLAAVDCDVSYDNRRVQTILFNHLDREWLDRNLVASRILLEHSAADGAGPEHPIAGRSLFRNVPSRDVLEFIGTYAFHQGTELRSDLLRGYIEAQNREGELVRWNVAVVGREPEPGEPMLDLGRGIRVRPLNRSKLVGATRTDEYASLGVITSNADMCIDLDRPAQEWAGKTPAQLQEMRPRGIGLLLVYPISKDSRPMVASGSDRQSRRPRAPLEAVQDLIGVAFVFPRASKTTPQRYVTVDLSRVEREEAELPPDEDED
jgi:hypothetical protein